MTTTAPAPPKVFVPEPHQQQTIDFITSRRSAGIWLTMGGGKTISTLTALQWLRPLGHILVVAPVSIARSTWLDEIEKWQLPIRTRSLIVDERDKKLTKAQRLKRFQEILTDPPTMYFINQELLTRSPLASCKVCGGRGVKSAFCTACQTGLIDQMPIQKIDGKNTITWPFPTVIIDESQGFKSHSSGRFKALARVIPATERVIELTGTPAPNGLEDLWSQVYLLDQGQALGRTITEFRNRWFTPKMIPGTTTPAKWIPNPGAKEEIYAAIGHLVMSAENTTLQLPELTIEDVSVKLPDALLKRYRDFKRELVIEVINHVAIREAHDAYDEWLKDDTDPEAQAINAQLRQLTGDDLAEAYPRLRDTVIDRFITVPDSELVKTVIAQNPAVLTSKLMQFASGTLYTADPDDPSTAGQYEVIHDHKLEMAEYLIRNNGGRPVLLAYHFTSDKEQLLKRLSAAGIGAEAFDGSRDMIRRWNDRQIPVMLVHPASAGHGLNLQYGGSTMIWYTLPFSLEHYLQTNARLHRPGQQDPVMIYRLITKGTQDERMPGVLMDKQNDQDQLIQAVRVPSSLESAVIDEIEQDLKDELSGFWSDTRL